MGRVTVIPIIGESGPGNRDIGDGVIGGIGGGGSIEEFVEFDNHTLTGAEYWPRPHWGDVIQVSDGQYGVIAGGRALSARDGPP